MRWVWFNKIIFCRNNFIKLLYKNELIKLLHMPAKLPFERSFATHPHAKRWSEKNDFLPRDIGRGSQKKCVFDCPTCDHEYINCPNTINKCKEPCQYCANRLVCGDPLCDFCLVKSFAYNEKAAEWGDNNEKCPLDILKSTHTKYEFTCEVCHHDFMTSPNYISNKNFCPFCGKKELCDDIRCEFCLNNSFASNQRALEWAIENGDVSPRDVFRSSADEYKFKCNVCKHTFETKLCEVTRGSFCPFCGKKELCDDDDCDFCFNNRFASSDKAASWSKKNNLSPREVFKSSGDKYFFDCPTCKHEFDITLAAISHNESFCPYCCVPPQKLCNNDKCKHCFENSFASHEKAKHWSKENEHTPREVFKGTKDQYKFKCPECKAIFEKHLNHIKCDDSFCPFCKKKTEKLLLDFLEEKINADITYNKSFEWYKNKRVLPFDFFIEKFSLIIELDGAQHFRQVWNWDSCAETQKRDVYKMECANRHGLSVIRISQEDVWHNRNNWKHNLLREIKKSTGLRRPKNTYIGDVYEDYPECNN